LKRRLFLKDACSLCIAVGAGTLSAGLISCSSYSVYRTRVQDAEITVPLSIFSAGPLQILRADDIEYDIAVRQNADGSFQALLLRCTHADNEVTPAGKGFVCSAHGSRFDPHGEVTRGPAPEHLQALDTSVNEDRLTVYLIRK
jgi:Rieske Fe-S protein